MRNGVCASILLQVICALTRRRSWLTTTLLGALVAELTLDARKFSCGGVESRRETVHCNLSGSVHCIGLGAWGVRCVARAVEVWPRLAARASHKISTSQAEMRTGIWHQPLFVPMGLSASRSHCVVLSARCLGRMPPPGRLCIATNMRLGTELLSVAHRHALLSLLACCALRVVPSYTGSFPIPGLCTRRRQT